MHDDHDERRTPTSAGTAPPRGRNETKRSERPASPCTEICTLDDEDRCLGCLRTLDEIVRWSLMSPAEQWSVIDAVATRRAGESH